MHELSIASALLDTVRAEAEARPGLRVRVVGMRVGELSGVDGDALEFCFETLVAGTPLAGAALRIDRCPRRQRCRACTHEFVVTAYRTECPACGSEGTDCVGGQELDLAWLEMEEA